MSAETVKLVNEYIQSDTVVIFSKSYCPYCTLAKDVFKNIDKKFTAIELDQRSDIDAEQVQAALGKLTGARTVPRVFVNGKCLGGGSDVKTLYDNGELEKYFS